MSCPECAYLLKRLEEVSAEHKREMKRTTVLSGALLSIYGIAKDNMWYPSTFKERGESGFKSSEPHVKNQEPSVWVDVMEKGRT